MGDYDNEYFKTENKTLTGSWVNNLDHFTELNIRIHELEKAIRSHQKNFNDLYNIAMSSRFVFLNDPTNLDINKTLWASVDDSVCNLYEPRNPSKNDFYPAQRPNFNEKEVIADDLIQRYTNSLNELSK